jgi:hypothetical protein
MRSLTSKKDKATGRNVEAERGKGRKGGRKVAQCCAKTSKNVAGCHD